MGDNMRLMQTIWDLIICSMWTLYDILLTLYYRIRRQDYIGMHVRIVSPSELRFHFKENTIAGGLSSIGCLIKIFVLPTAIVEEESIINLLEHEVMHQVLGKVHLLARHKFDNIQKPYTMLDVETGKWKFGIKYVIMKKDGTIEKF